MKVYYIFKIKDEFVKLYSDTPSVLYNILKTSMDKYEGTIDAGEIGLSITTNNLVLPCGIYGRWQSND